MKIGLNMMIGVNMKKRNKKDIVYLSITILLFLIIVFLIKKLTFFYGSNLDWYAQHISLPEYFRTLFYDTKELIPNFAMNIGGGQNIYNFSYYGLFSPIILISYLFPFIKMVDYLTTASIIFNIGSTVLLYYFLKKNKFSQETSFISSVIFILSAALSFHSHRHIMFINYMFFLILGLWGVDIKIKKNKNTILILSTFLMIMQSYYFSISGILVFIIYYLYTQKSNGIKDIFINIKKIMMPIIISILMSAILLLPTIYTIINNRMPSNTNISISELFLPAADNIMNLTYHNYGIGLTFISFIALIYLLGKDRKSLKLSLLLIVIVFFDIFNYLLNGFSYINPKSLIPFLPLFIYIIAIFIEDVINKKINYKELSKLLIPIVIWITIFSKTARNNILIESIIIFLSIYFYRKYSKKSIIYVPIIIIYFIFSLIINSRDSLEPKEILRFDDKNISEHLKYIQKEDKDFYRININYNTSIYPNKVFNNINYYHNTNYSSIDNSNFNKFYYDYLTNEMTYRNRSLVVSSSNLLSNMLLGNKYIISREKEPLLYDEVRFNNLFVYKNENILPIAFFNSNLISYSDFEKLNKYEQQVGYLKLIVNENITKNSYKEVLIKEEISLKDLFKSNRVVEHDDKTIEIDANHGDLIEFPLNKEYKNKILFVSFNLKEQNNDLSITINGMKNKLTNKNWKYYNANNNFNYTLSIADEDSLKMIFSKGKYIIRDLEVYSLDIDNIKDIRRNVTPLNITKRKGNTIEGKIKVEENGYFMFTIPYDKGFTAYVDSKEVDIEKLDYAFIGFPIKKGEHKIRLEYHSPLLKEAKMISLAGFILFIYVVHYEKNLKKRYK